MRTARLFLLFVVAALLASACSGGGGGSDEGDRANPKDGEVFLDAFAAVGPNPFTNSVAVAPVPPVEATKAAGTSAQGLRTVRGTSAGLYGASRYLPACDAVTGVDALIEDDDKAQAWVDALNDDARLLWSGGSKLSVNDIGGYLSELTAVFLLGDTRVTSHGFRADGAAGYQSVLQRGTAVMVDAEGVPRVRCAGFNPLIAPKPAAKPKYRGEPWEGFDQTKLLIVEAGTSARSLRVVDIHSQDIIEIGLGQTCQCDATRQPTTTTTLLEDETTTTTSRTGRTTTTQRRTATTARPVTTTTVATTTPATTPTTVPPTTTTPTTAL